MNKSDSKYFNTARRMDEALISILREKDFSYVTIKEICGRANVNRSTFYLHYENIGDLLLESIELINRKFSESMFQKEFDIESKSPDELFLITDEWIVPYLDFIKENKHIYKAVHSNSAVFGVEKTYKFLFQNVFSPILSKFDVPENRHGYIMDFYRYGLSAILLRWVDNDCAESTSEIMDIIKTIFDGQH